MISQVQKKSDDVIGENHSLSYDAPPTTGNLLVAIHTLRNENSFVSIPDGWSLAITSGDEGSFGTRVTIAYKVAVSGESSTVTFGNVSIRGTLHLFEYEGLPFAILDVSAGANSGATLVTSQSTGTTGVTTAADALVLAGVAFRDEGLFQNTWTNGFTQQDEEYSTGVLGHSGSTAHKILSATGTQQTTETFNTAARAAGAIAVFIEGEPPPSAPELSAAQVDDVIRLTWVEA